MLYCNVHVYSCKLLQFTDKVYSMSTGSSCLRTQARELIFVICADVAGTGCGSARKSWCSITAATVAASAAIAAIVATSLDRSPNRNRVKHRFNEKFEKWLCDISFLLLFPGPLMGLETLLKNVWRWQELCHYHYHCP